MILRTWRGSTRAEDAEAYVQYLRETGVREYRETPGNRGVFVARRESDGWTEFFVLSLWDAMDAVKSFAGEDPTRAVFYPEDDRYLVNRDLTVNHYDIVEGTTLGAGV